MSTSLLYHGFGLRQVEYVKTSYDEGAVHFFLQPKPEAVRCPTCHSPAVRPHGQKERRFRHLPIGRKRVELVMPIPRVECDHCGARRQIAIPFADPHKRYSRPLARYVVEVSRPMTVLDVAEPLEMSWDTVKEIQKQHLLRHYARPNLTFQPPFAVILRSVPLAIRETPESGCPGSAQE